MVIRHWFHCSRKHIYHSCKRVVIIFASLIRALKVIPLPPKREIYGLTERERDRERDRERQRQRERETERETETMRETD